MELGVESASQGAESERLRSAGSEPPASALAEAAVRHLGRLQRVTSALSEAVSVADVCGVLRGEMADALGARRACVALASEEGDTLLPCFAAAGGAGAVHVRSAGLQSNDVESPELQSNDVQNEESESRGVQSGVLSASDALPERLQRAFHQCAPVWPEPSCEIAALPLVLGTRRLGAVALELPAGAVQPSERALLEDSVRQLALALDRARMFQLAEQARERAEEANRAKDEFLSILGHELRNPLSPMLTALELMREQAGDVAVKERGIIERQLKHMARLVDDLLDVSRITRGSLQLRRAPVELARAVERAVELASPILEERAHRLTLAVPARGMLVEIDFHRIAQAIANLLINSAKYTPRGGSIQVGARSCRGRVLLEIQDDGIGIDPLLLQRIFEPFVQRQQAIDRSRGGLGLGLTIARRLVDLHGGSVQARSEGPGQGSTFTIELALLAEGVERARNAAPPSRTGVIARQADGAAVRVLVVDDNVDAAEMLADLLRAQGHIVGVAHDGPAALVLAERFRPQLALLDLGLPVMDGFDLAQRMKLRLRETPPKLVAVTGYGQPSDRARSKQAGFDEHLLKPIDLSRLHGIVSALKPAPIARCSDGTHG